MTHRTRKRPSEKPTKPYPDFPLFPHATRRWAKKIRGKLHYFGPWNDPEAALKRYLDEKDDLYAGRDPRLRGALTLHKLCNRFMLYKQRAVDAGELHSCTWTGYRESLARMLDILGRDTPVASLGPEDFARLRFALAKTLGARSLTTCLGRIRTFFKWAYDSDLLGKPVKYGPGFKSPSRRVLLQARQANGSRMFEAHEVRQLLDAADPVMRAMILLAVNCGCGNNDVGTLTTASLDLEEGWFNHPRPKTGTVRHVPLWSETIEAIRQALAARPKPESPVYADHVFLTSTGKLVTGVTTGGQWRNAVSREFTKLVRKLALRPRGFYALRHTFETIGGECRDQIAVDACMGHITPGIRTTYRERISEDRLRRVTDHVRAWLYEDQPVSIPITREVG